MIANRPRHIGQQGSALKKAHQCWERGQLAAKRGEWRGALQSFESALAQAPDDVLYALNLARAQRQLLMLEPAVQTLSALLQRAPGHPLAQQLMAECKAQMGDHGAAADCLLALMRDSEPTLEQLDALTQNLFEAGRFEACAQANLQALAIKVDHAQAHYLLGMSLSELGQKEHAITCLRTALALGYENGEATALSLLAMTERELGHWAAADQDLQALRACLMALPQDAATWCSVFACVTLSDDPSLQRRAAQVCVRHMVEGVRPLPKQAPAALPVTPPRRLRVGFVSSDFHQHATSFLLAQIFEMLDRSRFEVLLYSHGPDDGSAMRARLKAAADQFHDICGLNNERAAGLVREHQVDVLIDLKGHTGKNRLAIFAYRPAPVQASYLGFPGTTGAPFIDYFIGDAVASPLGHAAHFSEKLALMPHSYQPNDRLRPLPAPTLRAQHGLPDQALVLCGFNQSFKISAEVFDVWCRLLKRLPDSVLWLLGQNERVVEVLRHEAQARGVDPSRLVFAPRLPLADHLSRFALADIFLDTWPCNGHTTASDALWAGVPVVTHIGQTFVSRVAASLLTQVGLPELVCEGDAAYEAMVLTLAADAPRRLALRQHLHAARASAPLFDSRQYAQEFGDLLWRMAERHAQGLPPDHLA
jgi:predicted O-linked N-acetylglucosamine transferase (SPINDLY family)